MKVLKVLSESKLGLKTSSWESYLKTVFLFRFFRWTNLEMMHAPEDCDWLSQKKKKEKKARPANIQGFGLCSDKMLRCACGESKFHRPSQNKLLINIQKIKSHLAFFPFVYYFLCNFTQIHHTRR